MPVFEYTARTMKGDLVRDKIDLPNKEDVVAHIRKNKMILVQVNQAAKSVSFKFGGGVKTRDGE